MGDKIDLKQSFTILLLVLSLQSLFCQIDSLIITLGNGNRVDTISKIKVSDFKTHFYKSDLTPWIVLKDSGCYNEQKVKNGFWREYPIDTTALMSKSNIREKSTLSKIFMPDIIRLEGLYLNGKKEGVWLRYSASIRTKPYFWNLVSTSEYKDNLKNGKEVLFEPFSNDTMMIIIYKNDVPIKIIE
jgi:hypothetical protein